MVTHRTRWRRARGVWKVPFSCHNLFVEGASSSRHCSLGMSSSEPALAWRIVPWMWLWQTPWQGPMREWQQLRQAVPSPRYLTERCRGQLQPANNRVWYFYHLQWRLYVACTRLMLEQLKRLGAAVGRHRGSYEMMVTRQLFQRLSLTIMRWNAALRLTDGQIMTLLKQL